MAKDTVGDGCFVCVGHEPQTRAQQRERWRREAVAGTLERRDQEWDELYEAYGFAELPVSGLRSRPVG